MLSQKREQNIDKIQFILLLTKAKFISKRAVEIIANLIQMSKNSSYKHYKTMVINKNKCFNYYNIGHFGQDYNFFDYHIKNKSSNSGRNIK